MGKFFIKNKLLLIIITLILCIGGIFSYINIKRNEDPGFKIRTATITTVCPNMSADEVDRYVSRQIEDIILEMDEVEHIKVQSYDGLSVIFVDVYESYMVMQPIWDRLRRKVEIARKNLPSGLEPIVNDEFADVFGTIFSITGKDYSYKELKDIADNIQDELLLLENVGKVQLMGTQKEAVYLNFSPSDTLNNKINHSILKNYLQNTNVLGQGGYIKTGGKSLLIEGTSNFDKVEDIKNTPVDIFNKSIKLSDIYDIKKGYIEPPTSICRANGQNAILFILSMKDGGNILKWADEIKAEIKHLRAYYPIGINFDIMAIQGDYVKILTDKFTSSLVQSIAIVAFLVLIILGIKTGLIIGGIILCIILSTIFVMEKTGLGLDKISLSALIISLGILVDNSIVVAEGILGQIKDSIQNGVNKVQNLTQTAIGVTQKYQVPLLCASIITSCAFLPVYLAKSAVSEYSSALFKVMFITLLLSWFYSTTLLPYLITVFKPKLPKEKTGKFDVKNFFSPIISYSVNNPKKIMFITLLLTGLSLILFSFVPKIFFPDSDRNMYEIRINLQEGSNIYKTKDTIVKIEDFIKTLPETGNFSSYIGTSAPRYVLSSSPVADRENFGMILVNTDDFRNVDKSILAVKKFINNNFADVNSVVRKVPLGPPYDAPVEIRIFGQKTDKIFKYVYKFQDKLKNIDGVYLVKNDWGSKTPRIKIKIDNAAASRLNLTSYDILSSIRTGYAGDELSSYMEHTTNIPIIYRMEDNLRVGRNIESLQLLSNDGKVISLSEVAKTTLGFEYPKIFRRDNRLTVTIQGWIDETTTANAVIEKIREDLDKENWELNYGYEFGGTYENSKKGNNSIMREIPTAFSIIIMILIILFNEIKKPLITVICALLALTGANFGLFITGSYFGFMTFLGYICLVGIAVNNCVIFLESIESKQDKDLENSSPLSPIIQKPQKDSIDEAKSGLQTAKQEINTNNTKDEQLKIIVQNAAISRVIPVFLTAVTTIGGMLPLWIGRDPMFSSLAIAIIFGLLSSVFITLVVAPALYMIIQK